MSRSRRLVVVVAGLVAAGAILGSVATAGALLLVGTLTGALDGDVIVGALVMAPVIGAPLGALLGPPAALLFLRRTPLLQLFTVPTVTAMIGGGATFASFSANPIAGAVAGFAVGVTALALTERLRGRHRAHGTDGVDALPPRIESVAWPASRTDWHRLGGD